MKRAQVKVDFEFMPDVIPVLRDHGMTIVDIERCLDGARFTVEGPTLPDFCEGTTPLVNMQFVQIAYGKQRMVKISSIEKLV